MVSLMFYLVSMKKPLISPPELSRHNCHRTLCMFGAQWDDLIHVYIVRWVQLSLADTSITSHNDRFFCVVKTFTTYSQKATLQTVYVYKQILKLGENSACDKVLFVPTPIKESLKNKFYMFKRSESEFHLNCEGQAQSKAWIWLSVHTTWVMGNCTRSLKCSWILGDAVGVPSMCGPKIPSWSAANGCWKNRVTTHKTVTKLHGKFLGPLYNLIV